MSNERIRLTTDQLATSHVINHWQPAQKCHPQLIGRSSLDVLSSPCLTHTSSHNVSSKRKRTAAYECACKLQAPAITLRLIEFEAPTRKASFGHPTRCNTSRKPRSSFNSLWSRSYSRVRCKRAALLDGGHRVLLLRERRDPTQRISIQGTNFFRRIFRRWVDGVRSCRRWNALWV